MNPRSVALLCATLIVSTIGASQARSVYEDDRISVPVPTGWSATTVIEHAEGPTTSYDVPIGVSLNPDGDYILYLLTHHGQVSGIRGGRFSEIRNWVAPWTDYETGACNQYLKASTTTKVSDRLSRVDLYFDPRDAKPEALSMCGNPSVKQVLWYGSYFTQTCEPAKPQSTNPDQDCDCGGFFLYYPDLAHAKSEKCVTDDEMAFTLTFRADNPDDLPRKDDPRLREFLDRATQIVLAIKYKPRSTQ